MRLIFVKCSFCLLLSIGFISCYKEPVKAPASHQPGSDTVKTGSVSSPDSAGTSNANAGAANRFVTYTILQGQQYCVGNTYPPYTTSALHFVVQFDSSDIYTNRLPSNQYDYNKLYGFSDNAAEHHSFSARFGWRWCHNRIELSAYTYNDSVRTVRDIGGVSLNEKHQCAILVDGSKYHFVVDGDTTTVPRTSKTTQAVGYKLYPYFGGDEVAPHTINIKIQETK